MSSIKFDYRTQCSIEFDYVRLLDRSITERSIAFDWQNFFVSSIKFDYRTQSSDWVRLGSITERSISYAGWKVIKMLSGNGLI